MFFEELKEYEGMKPGLSRIKSFLKSIGNPQDNLKFIHIAGTNGKGSTAVFLAEILRANGYKTGLYTSPHLVDITERIKINEKDISKRKFNALSKKYISLAKKNKLSYFEYLTALAFIYFSAQKADIVVLETGLGGRFDATNVIKNKLAAVITSIGLDHCEILGNSISKIAFEKAGIIKKNTPVVCGDLPKSALNVIKRKAKPFVLGKDFKIKNIQTSLYGKHQAKNAALALYAAELLKDKGFKIVPAAAKKALLNTKWPARFDIRKFNGAEIIIDGAHNEQGFDAFFESLKIFSGNKKRVFVFAAMREKKYQGNIKRLSKYAKKIILPDLKNARAVKPEALKKEFAEYIKVENIIVTDGVVSALKLVNRKEKYAAVGSLYLAGAILKHI